MLDGQLDQVERITGKVPGTTFVDRGTRDTVFQKIEAAYSSAAPVGSAIPTNAISVEGPHWSLRLAT